MMSVLCKGESIEQQIATNLSRHNAIISKLCYKSAFVTRGCGSKACNVRGNAIKAIGAYLNPTLVFFFDVCCKHPSKLLVATRKKKRKCYVTCTCHLHLSP
jgi:hypothetical protein